MNRLFNYSKLAEDGLNKEIEGAPRHYLYVQWRGPHFNFAYLQGHYFAYARNMLFTYFFLILSISSPFYKSEKGTNYP